MALVIDNERLVREIERRAADMKVSPMEIVALALHEQGSPNETSKPLPEEVIERRLRAIRDVQAWFAAHRDPNDHRNADEITGYNDDGMFN